MNENMRPFEPCAASREVGGRTRLAADGGNKSFASNSNAWAWGKVSQFSTLIVLGWREASLVLY